MGKLINFPLRLILLYYFFDNTSRPNYPSFKENNLENLLPDIMKYELHGNSFTIFTLPIFFQWFMIFQVLRSGSQWSVGIQKTENSIYNAYLKAINEAQHYIYIENQFFISSSTENSDVNEYEYVKNKIGLALVEKVKEAHR